MIAVGVDTHKEKHLAVAVDDLGQLLAEITITADLAGYSSMTAWLGELDGEVKVGIEGAGSFGAGLCEYLQAEGVEVFEVERPRRRERRTGKSDRLDALIATKKVLAGEGLSTPRGSGTRLALQMLLVAYRSVVGERSRLYNQLQALNVGAPGALRERIGPARNGAVSGRSAPASSSRSTPRASPARQHSHAPTAPRHSPRPPANHPPPPQPRRRPPNQRSDLHDRALALRSPRPKPRLHRAQNRRREDQARGHAIPQATPLPPPLQAARKNALDNIEASNEFANAQPCPTDTPAFSPTPATRADTPTCPGNARLSPPATPPNRRRRPSRPSGRFASRQAQTTCTAVRALCDHCVTKWVAG